jgi:signal transduction histidine kinase
MRFGAKIGLVLLAVGVLPVALLGVVSHVVSRDELQRTIGRMQSQAAEDLALFTERTLSASIENLRLSAGALPLEDSSAFARWEISKMLAIPYRQLPFVSILGIVNDANVPLAGPVFERRPERDPAFAGREAVGDEDLDLFSRRIPDPPPAVRGVTMSGPYHAPRGSLRIAVSHRLSRDRNLVAEIVLRDVEARLAELSSASSVAYLVDANGDVLAHGQGAAAPLSADERRLSEVGFANGRGSAELVSRADGHRWLSAFAPLRHYGWGAVVAQPTSVAFAAADRVRFYTFTWAAGGLCLAVVLGTLLARRVTLPVQRLSRAARAVAAGDWGAELEARGKDEIGDLGRAFARMTSELRRRDEEIRAWNEELKERVAGRTAELKIAQDQILRARRLAALGSLGAGLSHELNNPMTAITGYLAILKKQAATPTQAEMIARAQEQASRIARIVEDLRSFADQERQVAGQRFALHRTVEAALSLYEDRIRAAGITLTRRIEDRLPDAQGDPVQIQQVVAHVVENAINAMPSGGSLDVQLGTVDGEALRLRIGDTGKGIPAIIRDRIFDPFFTTKGHAGQVGLGLSLSHSIVEAHHGRILVESEEGAGSAITVLLPAATTAHLA